MPIISFLNLYISIIISFKLKIISKKFRKKQQNFLQNVKEATKSRILLQKEAFRIMNLLRGI